MTLAVGDGVSARDNREPAVKVRARVKAKEDGGTQEVLGRENLVMELAVRKEAGEHRVLGGVASTLDGHRGVEVEMFIGVGSVNLGVAEVV